MDSDLNKALNIPYPKYSFSYVTFYLIR
jgi:hypothetical protein